MVETEENAKFASWRYLIAFGQSNKPES